ncbi:alpha/beta hydrolase [Spirochaetia bacterium]|nr:alpha/beta hydrolase [Spirochaetia bacterium]
MDIPFMPWPALTSLAKLFPSKRFPGLFYYDTGDTGGERPALILIHGLGDEADTWRNIIPLLADAGYRVLAPDLPGFGRSRVPIQHFTLSRHAKAVNELAAAVSAASIPKPAASIPKSAVPGNAGVILIGSSMGAAAAELAAIGAERKSPGLVKGLVLLDGCIPQGAPFPFSMTLAAANKSWYRSFRNNPEGLWRSLAPYYANLEGLPQAEKDFLHQRVKDRILNLMQERAYFSSMRSLILQTTFRSAYYRRNIKKWPGRIGLIWGEHDLVFPLTRAEYFRALFSAKPELTVIRGAGHLPHQEKPAETARAILKFCDGL